MSQQVGRAYRNHRRSVGAIVVLLVALAAGLVLWAFPAGAAIVTPKVVDLGGQNNDCTSSQVNSSAPNSFRIVNPVTGVYTDTATGTSFSLTVTGGGKTLAFTISGASAADVVIKGGTNSHWYDYDGASSSPVFGDTGLTAPPKGNTFYAISHTTFCYTPLTVRPTCAPDPPFSGITFGTTGTVEYTAQLISPDGPCKDRDVVMYSYSPGTNNLFATLNPTPGTPGTPYAVIEHIHWTGLTGNTQNPVTLWYDDTDPYNGGDKRTMGLCGSDPRTGDFTLPAGVTPAMPLANPPHTSCMLESTDSAGSGTNARVFDAWVYSSVDGARGAP
jgi:hypothetical protein